MADEGWHCAFKFPVGYLVVMRKVFHVRWTPTPTDWLVVMLCAIHYDNENEMQKMRFVCCLERTGGRISANSYFGIKAAFGHTCLPWGSGKYSSWPITHPRDRSLSSLYLHCDGRTQHLLDFAERALGGPTDRDQRAR